MLGRIITLLMTCLVTIPAAMAQAESLSSTMNVHVFPREGQDEVQQSMDEAECYSWAADRTGTDPFELSRQANEQMAASEQAMAQAQSAGQGSTGRAAAGGAFSAAVPAAVGRVQPQVRPQVPSSAIPASAARRLRRPNRSQPSQPRPRRLPRHKWTTSGPPSPPASRPKTISPGSEDVTTLA